MSQNDFNIANGDGATVRADINSALQALATLSSGTSAPSTTYAGQLWWDTTNNLIKIRNGANNAWITAFSFDGTTFSYTVPDGSITYAKLQDASAGNVILARAAATSGDYSEVAIGASQLAGRGSTGDIAAITIGSGLSMSGTTLSASGGFTSGGCASGRYYLGELMQDNGSTFAVTSGRQYATPFRINSTTTFDRIGLYVATGVGASNVRLGIYRMTNGVPAALVLDAGAVSTASSGAAAEITISQQLTPGDYVTCAIFSSTPTVNKAFAVGGDADPATANFWGSSSTSSNNNIGAYRAQAYGALPDPFGGSLTYLNSSGTPAIYLRAT